MAGSWIVKADNAGMRAFMNCSECQQDVLSRAQKVAARASTFGSGKFYADVQTGKNRCWAMAKAVDYKSRVSNNKHNSLLKSLDAAR
ncbi:MAG: hypothetical protein HUJ74_00385 [Lachnospiraceae bacterium]|nr:hypothetical protein [Lachnospiraceae bacterium]